MKNREKLSNDYQQLKVKIVTRAFVMIILAVAIIWLPYRLILFGNFANWMIALFERVFQVGYNTAYQMYVSTFRRNSDLLFVIGAVTVFFVIFRAYLNWFTRYFIEINKGIDALISENAGDVSLSTELAATEKKINAIKHTLEKRKLDAQFAEQQKNDLIVYLAHDLKTPLTTVIGYLTLLRDEPEMSIPLRAKYADIALDKAERLENLINEFFDITRFSLAQMTLNEETINLTRMLEQIAHEFHPMLSEKALELDMQLEPGLKITCDPEKLRRVFDNLFRNAMHYSYKETAIGVSLKQHEDHVAVRIVNHGKTIPQERLSQIFEQFYRLDASRSAATGGAGLGLAIAKRIVELHGGTIAAESENETIAFLVTLPHTRQEIV